MKLNLKTIATLVLPEGKSEMIVFDEDLSGFGLRIRAGGKRTWIYQFKIGDQNRRVTLGSVAALTPSAPAKRPASCTPWCAWAAILPVKRRKAAPAQPRRWPSPCKPIWSQAEKPAAKSLSRLSGT